MKKYGVLFVMLVLFVFVKAAHAEPLLDGVMCVEDIVIPVPVSLVGYLRPVRVERQEPEQVREEPNTAGCGVAGEFGLTDEPCEWNQWRDDDTDWFEPELEFAWMYED